MKIAAITGATQGIGLETARVLANAGLYVIVTGRTPEAIERGLAAFETADSVEGHVLDVADQDSVDDFFVWLQDKHARIDVLVNNAGRVYGAHGAVVANTSAEMIGEAINNNALGAWRTIQHALTMMNRQKYGRIVNVSSGMGALSDMGSGAVAYRISKTTLNALTVTASREAAFGVKVNAFAQDGCAPKWAAQTPREMSVKARLAPSGQQHSRMTVRMAVFSGTVSLLVGRVEDCLPVVATAARSASTRRFVWSAKCALRSFLSGDGVQSKL